MPSKFICLFFVCFFIVITSLIGQKTYLISLKDSITQKEIQYATIGLKKVNTGGTTDQNGHYTLKVSDLTDTIIISCLGYRPIITKVATLKENLTNSFYLSPITYNISEVSIHPKQLKRVLTLNQIQKKIYKTNFSTNGFLQQVARFFPAPHEEGNYYLGKVKILTSSVKSASYSLRIYENNSGNKGPGKDILLHQLIVSANKDIQIIDLSNYKLKMPTDGFYVAVEWLKTEENLTHWKVGNTEAIVYDPSIKGYRVMDVKELSSWSLNYRGEWRQLASGFNLAIEVELFDMQ